mmetsp:Transcript_109455/g.315208  ORF Transcript_109455/g.315208 Transcript_109455/m.315208 type:complete len:119 (+) Transcript_109455:27-383(+)
MVTRLPLLMSSLPTVSFKPRESPPSDLLTLIFSRSYKNAPLRLVVWMARIMMLMILGCCKDWWPCGEVVWTQNDVYRWMMTMIQTQRQSHMRKFPEHFQVTSCVSTLDVTWKKSSLHR